MKIEVGTVVRTVVLFLALVNTVLSAAGKPPIPVDNDTLEKAITYGWLVVSAVWSWWKNNSFTKAARIGDFHMRKAKREMEEDKRFGEKS